MAANKGCRPDPRSMPQSKEFDAGFDRTFGKPKAKNKGGRWVFNEKTKKLEPVGAGWVNPDSERVPVFTDRYLEGMRTYDTGEDIGSRAKRKAYMKRHGLADPQDFTEHRVKMQKKRADYLAGTDQEMRKEWRETFGRKLYEIESRKRRTGR